MSKKVAHFHCIQHVPFETPGKLGSWITAHEHSISYSRLFDNDPFPATSSFDGLIILGGPMSVHDTDLFPWLATEKRFVNAAIQSGKKILGICLGAQLLAEGLGSNVYSNPEKEIGFMPVSFTEAGKRCSIFNGLQEKPIVFHWHGETFDTPVGATNLAFSDHCTNQAFIFKEHVLALQFHPEITREIVKEMLIHEAADITIGPAIHSAQKIVSDSIVTDNNDELISCIMRLFFQCDI